MLSFKDLGGSPICYVKGGTYDKDIVFLNDPDNIKKDKIHNKAKDIPYESYIDEVLNNEIFAHLNNGRKKTALTEQLRKHILKDLESVDDDMNNYLHRAKTKLNEKSAKEFVLTDGEMIPLCNPTNREVIYIAGPSGSGKSTWIGNYADNFHKLFPKKPIYLFSRVDTDDALDRIKTIKRISLDEELINDPITPVELADSLVIFDDTDTIPDKKLLNAVNNLKDSILEIGRHQQIYVCVVSHLINNYKESRKVLNECHSIVIFPASGSSYAIKYCMKQYAGMDRQDINKLLKLNSRWVQVRKTYPQAVIYSKGVYLLSKDND